MIMRYGMRSEKNNVLVEVERNEKGKQFLIDIRRLDKRFKGCRIIEYFQARPNEITLNQITYIYVTKGGD